MPRVSTGSGERVVDTQKVIRPSRSRTRIRYDLPQSPVQVQRLKSDNDDAPVGL
jgi:hypothetical protein